MRLREVLQRRSALAVVLAVALSLVWSTSLVTALPAHAEAPGTPIESGPEVPSVDSATGLGDKLSADPNSKVRVATQNDGSNSAIVRISVFKSESDNIIYAGGATVFSVKSGQSISQTVLLPLESNLASIYALKTTDVRIELLAAFQGNDNLPGSFRATLPESRVDSSAGIGFTELKSTPQNVNLIGKGGIPSKNVRAVFISGTFEASAPATLQIGSISVRVSGSFALSTVVVPDEKGNVTFSVDKGSVKAKIWTRGYAAGSKMGDNSANLGGSFVPKSEKVLDGDEVNGKKQPLHINAQSDTTFLLILASAKATEADELTTLDIGSEHQEREQGAAIDTDLGALPQLLVAHPDANGNVNAIVHQGAAEVEAWHVGDFLQNETPGGISLEKAPEIRIESPAAGEDYSFQEHGGVTISGTVSTGSLSLSRVEVTATAASVRGVATRGGEAIPEKTANDQPAVQDDGSQTRVTIGNAEIRYLPDGQAYFEIFTAPPRDDDWTFEVTAYTRADTFKSASVTAHIQMPKPNDVVIAKNAFSIGNPDAPEGRNLDLRVIRLEEKAVLFERTELLAPGMILTAGMMENAPSGFIRKVVAVDQVPDGTMATTDAALITDAILQLNYVDRQNVVNYATPEDLEKFRQSVAEVEGVSDVQVSKEDVCSNGQGYKNAEDSLGATDDEYEQTVDDSGNLIRTKKNGEEVPSDSLLKYVGDGNDPPFAKPGDYDPKNPAPGYDVNHPTPIHDDSDDRFIPSCGDASTKVRPLGSQKMSDDGKVVRVLGEGEPDTSTGDQGTVMHFCLNFTAGSTFGGRKISDILKYNFQIEGGVSICTTLREQQYKDNWIKVDLDLRWDFWNMRPWAEIGSSTTTVTERTNEWQLYAFIRFRYILCKGKEVPLKPKPLDELAGPTELNDEDKDVLKVFKWRWTLMAAFVPVILGLEFWVFVRFEVDLDVVVNFKNVSLKTTKSGWAMNTRTGKRDISDNGPSKTSKTYFDGAYMKLRVSIRAMVGVDFLIYDCFFIRAAAGVILSFAVGAFWHPAIGTNTMVITGNFSISFMVFVMLAIGLKVPILGSPEFYIEHIWPLFQATLVNINFGNPFYNVLPGRADLDIIQGSTATRQLIPNYLYALVEDMPEGKNADNSISEAHYDPVPIAPEVNDLSLSCMRSDDGWNYTLKSSDNIDSDCFNRDGGAKTTNPETSFFHSDEYTSPIPCDSSFLGPSAFVAPPLGIAALILMITVGHLDDVSNRGSCVKELLENIETSYLLAKPYNIFQSVPKTTGSSVKVRTAQGFKESSIAFSENLSQQPLRVLETAIRNGGLSPKEAEFIQKNIDARTEMPARIQEIVDSWKCEKPDGALPSWTAADCIDTWDKILTDLGLRPSDYSRDPSNVAGKLVGEERFIADVAPKFGLNPNVDTLNAHLLRSDSFGHLEIYFLQPKKYHLIPIGEDRSTGERPIPTSYSYEKTDGFDFSIKEWTDGSSGTPGSNWGNKWGDHPEHLKGKEGDVLSLGSAAIRLVHESRNVTRGEAFREVDAANPILYKDGDTIEYQDTFEYPKYLCQNDTLGDVISSLTDSCPTDHSIPIYENEQTLQNVNIKTDMSGSWAPEQNSATSVPIHKVFRQGNGIEQEYDTDSFNKGTTSWNSYVGLQSQTNEDTPKSVYALDPGVSLTQNYAVKMVGDSANTKLTDTATLGFDKKSDILALNTSVTTSFNAFGSTSTAIASEVKFKSIVLNVSPESPTVGFAYRVLDSAQNPVAFSSVVDDQQRLPYSGQWLDLNSGSITEDSALVTPTDGIVNFAYLPPGDYTIKQYKKVGQLVVDESFARQIKISNNGSYVQTENFMVDYKVNMDTDVTVRNITRENTSHKEHYYDADSGAIPVKAGDQLEYSVKVDLPKYDEDGSVKNSYPSLGTRFILDYDSNNLEVSNNSLENLSYCERMSYIVADTNRMPENASDAVSKDYENVGLVYDSDIYNDIFQTFRGPEWLFSEEHDYADQYGSGYPTAQTYADYMGFPATPGDCHSLPVQSKMFSFYDRDKIFAHYLNQSSYSSAISKLYGSARGTAPGISEIKTDLGNRSQSPFVNTETRSYKAPITGGHTNEGEQDFIIPRFNMDGYNDDQFKKSNLLDGPVQDEVHCASGFPGGGIHYFDNTPCSRGTFAYSNASAFVPGDSTTLHFKFTAKEDFDNAFIAFTVLNYKNQTNPLSMDVEPQRTEFYNGEYGLKTVEQDSMPNKLVPESEYELVSAFTDANGNNPPINVTKEDTGEMGYSSQVIGDKSNHLRTDENGSIDLHYLQSGSYKLRRVLTPKNYISSANEIGVNAGYNLGPHRFVDSLLYTPKFKTSAELQNVTRGTKDDLRFAATNLPDGTTDESEYSALNLKQGDALKVVKHIQYSADDNSGIAYGARLKVELPENVQLTGTGIVTINGTQHEVTPAELQKNLLYLGDNKGFDIVRISPTSSQCEPNDGAKNGFLTGQSLAKPPYSFYGKSPYNICYLDPAIQNDMSNPDLPQFAWNWQITPGDDITVSLDATVLEDGVGSVTTSLSYKNNYFEDDFAEYDAASEMYYGRLNLQARAKNLPDIQDGATYKPQGKFELAKGVKYALYATDDSADDSAGTPSDETTTDPVVELAGTQSAALNAGDVNTTDTINYSQSITSSDTVNNSASPYDNVGQFFDKDEVGGESVGSADGAANQGEDPSATPAINAIHIANKARPDQCSDNNYAKSHQDDCRILPYSDSADEEGYVYTDENGELEVDYLEAGHYCAIEIDVPKIWKHTAEHEKCFTISDFRKSTEHLSADVSIDVDYDPTLLVQTQVRNLTRGNTNGFDSPELSDAPWEHDVVAKGGDKLQMKYSVEIPEALNASYVWNPKFLVYFADGFSKDVDGNATDISNVGQFDCVAKSGPRGDPYRYSPTELHSSEYLQEDSRLRVSPGEKFEVYCSGVAEDTNGVFLTNVGSDYTKKTYQDVSIVYPSQAWTRVVDDSGAPVFDPSISFELLDGGVLAEHDGGEEDASQAESKVSGDADWNVLDPTQVGIDDLTKGLRNSVDFSNATYARVDLSADLHDQSTPYSPNLGADGYLHPGEDGRVGVYYLPEGNYVLHQIHTASGYYFDDDARSFGLLDKSAVTSYHNVQVGDWVQHKLEPFNVLMALRTNPDDAYSTHTHVLHPEETADIVTDFALPAHLNSGSLSQLALYMHAPHFIAAEQFNGHYQALEQFARDNLKVIYYAEDSGLRVTTDALLTEGNDYTVSWLDDLDQAQDEDLLFSIEFADDLVKSFVDQNAHIALSYQIEGRELYRGEESFEVHEQAVGEVNWKKDDSNDIGLYGNLHADPEPAPTPPPGGTPVPNQPKWRYTIDDDSSALDNELQTLQKELKKTYSDYGKSAQASADAETPIRVSVPLWLWSIFILILLLLAAARIIYRIRRRKDARRKAEGGIIESESEFEDQEM